MKINDEFVPEIVSIGQMCKLLNLSRSRFYMLLADGTFLPPVYSIEKHRRCFYTRQMARRNIEAKHNNLGINGKVSIFYNLSPRVGVFLPKTRKKKEQVTISNSHAELREGLKGLGMPEMSVGQITAAVVACFPNGTENIDQSEILRAVFRYLRHKNSIDNVRR